MTETPDSDLEVGRAEATRARLQEAAIQAFAEKGFHGTTTRDIAAAAGMSPAALYVHHKSKEQLLYLISRDGHEATLHLIRGAVESADADPERALRQVMHDFALHHAQEHTSARIVNYELAALAPEHLAEIRGIRHQIEEELRSVIQRGVDLGAFKTANSRMTAAALLSLGIDLARWYRPGNEWSPEDIAAHYADLAVRIVGIS